jgi:hypothetical protein
VRHETNYYHQHRARARGAVLAILAAFLLLASALLALGPSGGGPVAVVDEARAATTTPTQKLAELRVRAQGSMAGYSRDRFDHWSNAQSYGWTIPSFVSHPGSCDARDAALLRDGRGEEQVGPYCDMDSGTWFDPYTGRTYYDPSEIDVDHVVPLANAWRSGAASWTDAKRERFANVPLDLLSVEDNANASKGDKGPEAWRPPRTGYHCAYAKKWVDIKHYWKLGVTSQEKAALKQMLGTCGG